MQIWGRVGRQGCGGRVRVGSPRHLRAPCQPPNGTGHATLGPRRQLEAGLPPTSWEGTPCPCYVPMQGTNPVDHSLQSGPRGPAALRLRASGWGPAGVSSTAQRVLGAQEPLPGCPLLDPRSPATSRSNRPSCELGLGVRGDVWTFTCHLPPSPEVAQPGALGAGTKQLGYLEGGRAECSPVGGLVVGQRSSLAPWSGPLRAPASHSAGSTHSWRATGPWGSPCPAPTCPGWRPRKGRLGGGCMAG